MKNLLRSFIVVFFIAFYCTNIFSQNNKLATLYKLNEEEVVKTLTYLTSDELEGRESGTAGIEKAAIFLEEFLAQNNIRPYFKTYRDTLSNFKPTTYNIVGYLEGNDSKLKEEYIVLGAHYDHIGLSEKENNGDKINNGANDNASGVIAVTEIAKYFEKTKSNKRSLLFVFFSAEEKGLLGSKHLVQKLKAQNFNIYMMLNFEMIGVPMKREYMAYITGFEKSNMAQKLNAYSGKNLIGFLPKEQEYQLFKRSDNYSFFSEFNVPSQTVCTFDFENFNYYHDVGDDFAKIDIPHITSLIETMLPVIEKMTNTSTKEIVLNK